MIIRFEDNFMKDSNNVYIQIEILRKNLIESGLKYGLIAPQTINLSQELDKLLNLQKVK